MRRMLALCAVLVLMLVGCGTEEITARAERVRQQYAALLTDTADGGAGYVAEATVTLCRETENVSYTLHLESDTALTRVTVLAPELLAGTTAQLTGDALALEYDGIILDAGSTVGGLTAVSCVPLTIRAVGSGTLTEQNEETFGDIDRALRLSFESEASGGTLRYTVYFDENGAPIWAEVAENEKIAAFMEFTSFTFCDRIASDGNASVE